jgi:integrase
LPKLRLTEISVRNLAPPASGQETHWDASLPGFGIRLSAGGGATWIVMHGKDRRRLSVGKYPVVGIAKAREEAKKLLAEASLRKNASVSITVESLVAQFLKASEARNKPRTTADYCRLLHRHLVPQLGKRRVGDLRARDVSRLVDGLVDTPSEANHALTAIKAVLGFAHRHHYIENNPALSIPLPGKRNSRDRILSEHEIAVAWKAAMELGYPFGHIVKLCLLTGQRRGEIALMKWSYVDIKARLVTFPAEMVKNNRQHTFPYGDAVAAVLEEIAEVSEYLFPAGKPNGLVFNGWAKQKAALDRLAPLPHWTLHDLRRTFSSQLAALGIPIHVTEKLLNHVSGTLSGVAGVYNRYSYAAEMRAAMEAYEVHILRLAALAK